MNFFKSSILPVAVFLLFTQFIFADPPNWTDNPGAYEFTATISGGIVQNEGVQMGDEGDLFAAFDDDGNVRGIGLMLFPPFGPYQGTPVFEVQLRSNAAGDLLSFKYYDASEDAILDIVETYEFVINDILGDVINPIFFNIQQDDDNAPNWVDCPGCYEFTATISGGIVQNEGVQMGDDGDLFAAFDDDGNVRGVGLMLFPPFGPYQGTPVFEVQLRSNAEGDLLHFKYYDASEDAILDIVETYEFVINDILGDVINPIFFNIGSGDEECVDDDAATAPVGGCAAAVATFGCDFLWGGVPLSELCPVSCDACGGEECVDDDEATAPVGGCAAAVATFGCDFLWGGVPLNELCPVSCDACGGSEVEGCTDDTACNFNPEATVDDGSCLENDCAGECGGSAEVDECGECNGGNAAMDDCGVCDGDNADDLGCGCFEPGPSGCDNACGSTLENDECGVCGGSGIADGACDCDGNVDLGCGCGLPGPSGCDETCDSTLENDECGVCGGDGSSCQIEVLYSSDADIGGFQFNVDGVSVIGASGGDAETNGFSISTSATLVLGFSFTGSTIPAGSGVLTVLQISGDFH